MEKQALGLLIQEVVNIPERDSLGGVREDCWTQALYAFGTAMIFKWRARRLGRRLRALTFIGIGVPLGVGGAMLSFSMKPSSLSKILVVASALLFIQLIWSAWALVAKWDDRCAYAIESMTDNFRLAYAYAYLAEHAPVDITHRFEVIEAERSARESRDNQQDLTQKENRRGMRAALSVISARALRAKTCQSRLTWLQIARFVEDFSSWLVGGDKDMARADVERVIYGWLELSDEEKNEFIDWVNQYNGLAGSRKVLYEETLRKAVLGPVSRVCICCGR